MDKITLDIAINKWFDLNYTMYDKMFNKNSVYLYYHGDQYANIRIDKKYKVIYYYYGFYKEFSLIFNQSIEKLDYYMGRWIEDSFGLVGFEIIDCMIPDLSPLEIPK